MHLMYKLSVDVEVEKKKEKKIITNGHSTKNEKIHENYIKLKF